MRNKREKRTVGLALTGFGIFILIYTYFYTSTYNTIPGPAGAWTESLVLSVTAMLVGMLVELSRFWGRVIQFKTDADLLIIQGVPAGILSLIPAPYWLQSGGQSFPFIFFADPRVTAISGVWLGMVLLRGFFNFKKVKEEDKKTETGPRIYN